ncbi:Conserved TM helix [Moheibacter sediminis]|uniref:Conserved TM helix n=2 Tax=Moheibacter sediminis TaxID=1434700 RepID=A0A1W1ZNH9_9FLAO|nr:Conserved TM helix [Moheibacter sediminis]
MKMNFGSLENPYYNFLDVLPNILMGLAFIIGAWIIFKLVVMGTKKLLKVVKIEKLNSIINDNELIRSSNIEVDVSKIIISVVKCLMALIIIVVGADMLNLPMVSEQVGNLLEYLPKFFSAVLIFAIGTYLASQAKKLIQNLLKSFDSNGSKAVGGIVFYLIFIFVSITALNQAGVDTQIISNNISFILGAALITITLAVGLGSRDIVYRLILGFYTKKNLEIGMKIQIGEQTGIIEAIDNICLVLRTENEKIVYPIKKINNQEIKILN